MDRDLRKIIDKRFNTEDEYNKLYTKPLIDNN